MQVTRDFGRSFLVLLVTGAVCFLVLQATAGIADTDPDSTPTPGWPDTVAAKLAIGFLAALETDDLDTIRDFLEQHRSKDALKKASAEERAADLGRINQQIGAMVVHEVHAEGDLKVTAIVQSKKLGMWLSLTFELESGCRISRRPERSRRR